MLNPYVTDGTIDILGRSVETENKVGVKFSPYASTKLSAKEQ